MKPRKLFIFRMIKSGKCGLVRAFTPDEAIDLLMEHIGEDVELYKVPTHFTLFVPQWL